MNDIFSDPRLIRYRDNLKTLTLKHTELDKEVLRLQQGMRDDVQKVRKRYEEDILKLERDQDRIMNQIPKVERMIATREREVKLKVEKEQEAEKNKRRQLRAANDNNKMNNRRAA